MIFPINPYEPGTHDHRVFERGCAETAKENAPKEARHQQAMEDGPRGAMRMSSHDMLMLRAEQLESQARALRKLAKHASAMEGEADEALWLLVVNQRP